MLEEVERRARGGCDFTLTVPPERHPDAPDWPPQEALELVRHAAKGRPVELVDGGADAAATIGDLVEQGTCDEILLSTPPEHHAHWHRHGLPEQIQALGIPVTVIPPDPTGWSYAHGSRMTGCAQRPAAHVAPPRSRRWTASVAEAYDVVVPGVHH